MDHARRRVSILSTGPSPCNLSASLGPTVGVMRLQLRIRSMPIVLSRPPVEQDAAFGWSPTGLQATKSGRNPLQPHEARQSERALPARCKSAKNWSMSTVVGRDAPSRGATSRHRPRSLRTRSTANPKSKRPSLIVFAVLFRCQLVDAPTDIAANSASMSSPASWANRMPSAKLCTIPALQI